MLNNEKGSGLPTVFMIILVLSGLLTTMLQGNLQVAATTNIIDEVNAFNLNSEDYILLAQNDLKSYMQEKTFLEFKALGENGDLAKINEIEDSAIFNGMLDIELVTVYDNFSRLYNFSYTDEALTNSREYFVSIKTDPLGNLDLETFVDDQFSDVADTIEDENIFDVYSEFITTVKTNHGRGNFKLDLDYDMLYTEDIVITAVQNGGNGNGRGNIGQLDLQDSTLLFGGDLTLNDILLIKSTPYYYDDDGYGIIYVNGDLHINSSEGYVEIYNTLILVSGQVFIDLDGDNLTGDNFCIISIQAIDNIDESEVTTEGVTYWKHMEEDAFFYIGDNEFTSLSTIFASYGISVETGGYDFYNN